MKINNPISGTPVISSYHDFSGLVKLKSEATTDPSNNEGALRAAAQQFEATFIQEMMRTMRQSCIKSDLYESNSLETFEGMFDKEISLQISKRGGLGVADLLVKNLQPNHSDLSKSPVSSIQNPNLSVKVVNEPSSEEFLKSRIQTFRLPTINTTSNGLNP